MSSFFRDYLYVKNQRCCFIPHTLMIKDSYNLIWPKHILANNFKIYIIYEEKNFSFLTTELIFNSELYSIRPYHPKTNYKSRCVWTWLGMPSQPHPTNRSRLRCYLPRWLYLCKKSKTMIISFQTNWWPNNSAIPLDKSLF